MHIIKRAPNPNQSVGIESSVVCKFIVAIVYNTRVGFQAFYCYQPGLNGHQMWLKWLNFETVQQITETHVGAIRTIRNISNIFAHNCNIKAYIGSGSEECRLALVIWLSIYYTRLLQPQWKMCMYWHCKHEKGNTSKTMAAIATNCGSNSGSSSNNNT